jgi:hypothetical protein
VWRVRNSVDGHELAVDDRSVTSPAAFTDADNWTGGFYELAIEVGETSDERLGRALGTLWRAACIRGCYGSCDREPPDLKTVPCTVESLERFGHLRGTVDLPGGLRTVCGAVAVREDHGPDWLDFYLPMGALAGAEPRVGAFPFGNDGGNVSVTAWREPIDAWLAGVAAHVYTAVEYKLGLIGWEASGQVYAKDLDGDPPLARGFGYLLPGSGGLRYLPATL